MRKQNFFTALLLISSLVGWQCKSTQPAQPEAIYTMNTLQPPISSLYIPISITHADLSRIINQAFKGLSLDNRNQPKDGFLWTLAIKRALQVELDGQKIISVIPMDVHLLKELGFTSLRANGELELTLQTLFNIRDDWTVQTYTTVKEHRWIRKPVAKVAGLTIPVSTITSWVIDFARPQLTRTIDQQIQENIDLRALLAPLWTVLRRPVEVSKTMRLWFRFEPRVAGIETFVSQNNALHSAVHLTGLSRLKVGSQPTLIDPEIDPQFSMTTQSRDSLRMAVHTEIPYADAERMAEENLIGKDFGSGSKQVTVEGIDLYGQINHLIISLRLRGAYNGVVHLRGKPVLNIDKNQVELDNLDFDVQTRNVLHRSAAWLFKGNIRSTLENALVFPLENDLDKVAKEISLTINNLKPGPWISMEAGEMDLRLRDIILTPEGMVLDFLLSGQLAIHLKALDEK